jgi:hypothetical protein
MLLQRFVQEYGSTAEVSSDSGDSPLGCMKGQIWISDDFDEPLDDFAEYM